MIEKIYRLLFLPLFLLTGIISSKATNLMYLTLPQISYNTNKEISLYLNNEDVCYGFQADITLPENLNYVFSDNDPVLSLSGRLEGFNVVSNLIDTNTLRIGAFSMVHDSVKGNSGLMLKISVISDYQFQSGPVSLSNIHLVGANDRDITLPDYTVNAFGTLPNSVSMADIEMDSGERKTVNVTLNNQTTLSAFQFDILLPDGFSINEESLETLSRLPNQELGIRKISENKYRIVGFSQDNSPINGTTGAILSFQLTADSTLLSGLYSIRLFNIIFSDENGREYKLEDTAANIRIQQVLPESVAIKSTGNVITEGETLQLTATVTPANAITSLTWTSSDPDVATVDKTGLVTALTAGECEITVTTYNNLSATKSIKVLPRTIPVTSIELDKSSYSGRQGSSVQLTATVTPENATDQTVTWSSQDTSVATVDLQGLVSLIGVGQTVITATCGNVSADCVVTVAAPLAESIALTPANGTIKVGENLELKVAVTPANAEYTLSWSSSDPKVATVSESGVVTGVTVGEANITVTTDNGVTATAQISVLTNVVEVTSVSINPENAEIVVDETMSFTATVSPSNATDKTLTWITSDTSIATIDKTGKVTAIKPGTVNVTVTASNGKAASATLKVKPIEVIAINLDITSYSDKVGGTVLLTASIQPENATDKSVKWESSTNKIASVSAEGLVTLIAEGSAVITAISSNGLQAACEITVIAESSDYPSDNPSDNPSDDPSDNPSDDPSDNPSDDPSDNPSDDPSDDPSDNPSDDPTEPDRPDDTEEIISVERIELSSYEISDVEGTQFNLTATVYPENATEKACYWESSDEKIVTITQYGLGKIVGEGNAVITVTAIDGSGVKAQCFVSGYAGVVNILADPKEKISVYSTEGRLIKKDCIIQDLKSLIKGIYIIVSNTKQFKISL